MRSLSMTRLISEEHFQVLPKNGSDAIPAFSTKQESIRSFSGDGTVQA